jgi:hypothetical protein
MKKKDFEYWQKLSIEYIQWQELCSKLKCIFPSNGFVWIIRISLIHIVEWCLKVEFIEMNNVNNQPQHCIINNHY